MVRLAAWAAILLAAPIPAMADDLPGGFVYLADIAPRIRQDIRYAGGRNFTGKAVPGYKAAECILADQAAHALREVQEMLSAQGLGLLVLDCYRPAKAVHHFIRWADAGGPRDPAHNPRTDRKALVAEGYIARRSGHSAGYAVDLTLADAQGTELGMGTQFDFFDPLAQTTSRRIPAAAIERRRILVHAMARGGFVNYSREWWHFSLRERSRDARSHDFDITPRPH